jgi:O-antigen/teichoic acid export membrane protein
VSIYFVNVPKPLKIQMRRFFVKNILFVIAVNVLVKPIWVFFIDRTVQNRVGPEAYGTYNPLLSLSIIFSIILDFGITNYNSRTIAQNPDKLETLFPAMLSARLALIVIYLGLSYTLGWLLGYKGWELTLLLGVLLIQSLNALVSFVRSNVAALHKFKTDGILSVTDRLLMIIICGFLLVYPATAHQFRIEWFVITQIVCYFLTSVIGYLILRRIGRVKLRFSLHIPTIFSIMRASFPYALLIFMMSVYNRADAMLIERLCKDGKVQSGIWAAAFRLLDMANMFGLMFATMLLPLFGRMLSQKQTVQPIIRLCVNLLLPLSFMVAIAGIFFSPEIMHLLYKNSTGEIAGDYNHVFAYLIASFPAWCMMYVYSTLLTANGSLKALNIIAFTGVVINLSLNFYLIPRYNATGGAITSFITQTSLAIAFMFCARHILKLPVNVKWIAAHAGYMLLILLLAYCVITAMRDTAWVLQLVTFGGICVALMFVFRFVSVSSVRQLMNKRAQPE